MRDPDTFAIKGLSQEIKEATNKGEVQPSWSFVWIWISAKSCDLRKTHLSSDISKLPRFVRCAMKMLRINPNRSEICIRCSIRELKANEISTSWFVIVLAIFKREQDYVV
jgi:hypothetical protein